MQNVLKLLGQGVAGLVMFVTQTNGASEASEISALISSSNIQMPIPATKLSLQKMDVGICTVFRKILFIEAEEGLSIDKLGIMKRG